MLFPTSLAEATTQGFWYVLWPLTILCDNISAINIAKNLVHHTRTKHIDIRHHFLSDHVEKGNIILVHCRTEDQLTDIFTKALNRVLFETLRHF